MPAPDIVLPNPMVLIAVAGSVSGLLPIQPSTIQFGTVILVYDTSDNIQAGNSVMFDASKGQKYIYGSTICFMISDEFITGTEILPP